MEHWSKDFGNGLGLVVSKWQSLRDVFWAQCVAIHEQGFAFSRPAKNLINGTWQWLSVEILVR
jgi:hypothetical protein